MPQLTHSERLSPSSCLLSITPWNDYSCCLAINSFWWTTN